VPEEPNPHRLPRHVEPQHYDLTLSPNLDDATFAGEAQIRVLVHEATSQLVLNAAELEILSVDLVSDEGERLEASGLLDEELQRLTLTLDGTATPGHWTLNIAYSGILNDKLRGFYRSTFEDAEGFERVIATTQFESTDARRAFPCWDEPDRKATFGITLVVDDDLTAISNSPVLDEIDLGDGKRQVRFAPTMKMSTYLVAFVVGPFVCTDAIDVDGVPLRVACVPGKLHLTDFALECGAHALRYFTGYFGLPYPGDKLDLIAVPDFAFGAMENLGAVTFRETALLVDHEIASRLELERVADVVAHEIAHMWFGDLVTMKWWNGIWLNEAFATFMELLCVDHQRPDWKRFVSFGMSRDFAMRIDGLTSTRPIEYPVESPDEAEAMFDVLTYQKGSAVVRMLEQYVGDRPFQEGIASYIKAHSYGNTETTDLWDAIEESTGEPARVTMDSWIFQGGYPMVSVEWAGDRSAVTLNQQRFRYLGGGATDERWQVPVLLRARVDGRVEHQRTMLTERSTTVQLTGPAEWVVVNDGGSGYYRVHYPPELAQQLVTPGLLEPLERFNLVSDGWATTLAGESTLADFLALIRPLSDEDDPDVWAAMLGPLHLVDRIAGDLHRPALRQRVRELVSPAFTRLGWTPVAGEGDRTGTLRANLLDALGNLADDPDVIDRARELHASYLDDRASVDNDLVPSLVRIVGRHGGEAEYATFLDRMRHPQTPQEETRYLFALAELPHAPLLRRTLELAMSEVRVQNAPFLIGAALGNHAAGPMAWEFVEEHWDDFNERFPHKLLTRIVEGVTALVDADLAARVRAFLDTHPISGSELLVEQSLERLDVNVAFRQREEPRLGDALGG
jgi:puromycin-sensitive aminopeptidase